MCWWRPSRSQDTQAPDGHGCFLVGKAIGNGGFYMVLPWKMGIWLWVTLGILGLRVTILKKCWESTWIGAYPVLEYGIFRLKNIYIPSAQCPTHVHFEGEPFVVRQARWRLAQMWPPPNSTSRMRRPNGVRWRRRKYGDNPWVLVQISQVWDDLQIDINCLGMQKVMAGGDLLAVATRCSAGTMLFSICTRVTHRDSTMDRQCYDLDFKKEGGGGADMKKSVPQLIEYYKSWLSKYPFVSIEVGDGGTRGDRACGWCWVMAVHLPELISSLWAFISRSWLLKIGGPKPMVVFLFS